MYYKIEACHNLARLSKKAFDLEIRIRPDYILKSSKQYLLSELYKNSLAYGIVYLRNKWIRHIWNLCGYSVDDCFAIGAWSVMDAYSRVFSNFQYLREVNAFDCPDKMYGHVNLEYQLFIEGLKTEGLNLSPSFVDPEKLDTAKILEAIKKDISLRPEIQYDKPFIEALSKDLKAADIS